MSERGERLVNVIRAESRIKVIHHMTIDGFQSLANDHIAHGWALLADTFKVDAQDGGLFMLAIRDTVKP